MYTVYAAELVGINLALTHAPAESAGEVHIFVDNQAAILACHDPSRPSGPSFVL